MEGYRRVPRMQPGRERCQHRLRDKTAQHGPSPFRRSLKRAEQHCQPTGMRTPPGLLPAFDNAAVLSVAKIKYDRIDRDQMDRTELEGTS